MATPRRQETVSLDTLSAQQLNSVKKQLDDEVEHLTSSYAQLSAAQSKFKECARVVKTGASSLDDKKEILVPLTTSLYVRGKLSSPDRVIVDVGTGFFVEKDSKSASEFYDERVKELGSNIQELEVIVQSKTNNLRVVEEGRPSHLSDASSALNHTNAGTPTVLRQRVLTGENSAAPSG